MKETVFSSFKFHSGFVPKALPYGAFLLAVVLWGSSFSVMKTVLQGMHPWTVMWFRMVFAFAALLPFLPKLEMKKVDKADWKLLLPLILLQPCGYFLLESSALRLTTSSQAGIISALVPVFVFIGSAIIFRNRFPFHHLLGLVLSVGGIALLTLFSGSLSGENLSVWGNLLEIFAMLAAAVCIFLVGRLAGRINPWTMTAWQIIAGLVFFSPGLVIYIFNRPPLVDWRIFLLLAYLGIGVSLGAFGLYNWGVTRLPAVQSSIFINLVPVAAIAFGWCFLGEKPGSRMIFAAVFIITGALLVQWKSKSAAIKENIRQ